MPLYSSSYNFTRELYRIKQKLPKALKHDLGNASCESALKILKCVVLANNAKEKGLYISRLLLETEVQWVLTRLMFDLRGITEGEFKALSERLTEIEKQARGWNKWQQNGQSTRLKTPTPSKSSWHTSEKGLT